VESLENKCPTYYHPTHNDDRFHQGCYQVIHKIGPRSHSTAWLAKDIEENKYVAWKILTSHACQTKQQK
ncbi:hypothetical protein K432DRAFT_307111, partial [Lepidopterella palustris CBS 459.81]